MELLDITLLAVQALSLVGILTTIAILFHRKKYYEQKQKEYREQIEIEKIIIDQQIKAFKHKVQELKQLVDRQNILTEALVKDSEQQLEKKTRGRKKVPVLVTDLLTHEEKAYDSIEAFAKEKNLSVATCRSAKHCGHILNNRYIIR